MSFTLRTLLWRINDDDDDERGTLGLLGVCLTEIWLNLSQCILTILR